MASGDRLAILRWIALAASAVVPLFGQAPPRRTIRVVIADDYAPYVFRSAEGRVQGILIDRWRAWEKQTGVHAEIHVLDSDAALRGVKNGDYDVIDRIVQTAEREKELDFGPPYDRAGTSIFFRREIGGITDLTSLEGFAVGVKTGDPYVDTMRANGVRSTIGFAKYDDIVRAAAHRQINVFVADDAPTWYLMHKAGIAGQFRQSTLFRDDLRRGVRKGDGPTLQLVNRGFATIPSKDLKEIDGRWFGQGVDPYHGYVQLAEYAAIAAIVAILALFVWNRALSRKILQRTAALRESEQRFRQIAENISEVFWLTDTDTGSCLYLSPAYEKVWGRPREAVYGSAHAFVSAVHPDDRDSVIAALKRVREEGFDAEYRVVRPDGSVRWIWDRGFPIEDEDGRVYRVAGIAEDMTDRRMAVELVKQAEDHIRRVIDTIPSMVWCLLPDGRLDFINQRWVDYTGISLADARDEAVVTLHPDDVPHVMEKWAADMKAGIASEDEMRLRGADGKYRWFLVRTVPLRNEQGEITYWYGMSTDIEDRKSAEEQLAQRESQLRALSASVQSAREEERIRIAREIHDELGSALTSLRWDLESIRKTIPEPELPKLSSMLEATDTMIHIVRRIASDLRPAVLDVLGLEEAIEWQARQFETRTGIAVRYESSGAGLALDAAQSTAVFRIFQEALTNVLRHARATRVDVTVAEDTGSFRLVVADNGKGIADEERVGENSIGLLGMQERAHLIGGVVDVTGVAGGGTTVTLRVPRYAD